ncbi:dynein light chain Tctex-type protein 2B [Lampetra fluviatilis]
MAAVAEAAGGYSLRPNFQHRFRKATVGDCIQQVLKETLEGKHYDGDESPALTRAVGDAIRERLKELGYDRYKTVVQVVIGEQRGEGVRMVARCLWDSDTDNYAQHTYNNESLFCIAVAFGCFYY